MVIDRYFDEIKPDVRYKDWFFTTKTDLDIENDGLLK